MKILVLAGGADQIALIQELHKYGHQVILVDYFDNPPAKPFADKHIKASTLDIVAVKKIAEDENVELVTTACTDQALLTVAKVSEQLALPCYISYQTGLNVTNKEYMKTVLYHNNIPTAKHIIVSNVDNIQVRLLDFHYPLVVKPVDCNSSKGVIKVNKYEDLEIAVLNAINYSRTNTAIIEEFKDGQELSCDFFIDKGEVKLLSITSSKKIKNRDSFTIIQSYYSIVSEDDKNNILKIGQDVAKAFNLDNTPLLVQLIKNENGLFVIEFSARMGGGSKYKLIQVVSGVNIMAEYVNLILGNKVKINPNISNNRITMSYIYCNPGKICEFKGFEELAKNEIIDCYFKYKTPGMSIEKAENSGDRAAGFLISTDSDDKMVELLRFVDDNIAILDENGKDIMIHGLYM